MPIGKITEFDVQKDDWRLYIERLEQYFVVNEVKSELFVPTLITIMGAESYELLVSLCTPDKPKSKTFIQIVDIMEKHLQPKPSELAERYKFRKRTQQGGESIAEYIAVLKKMSKTCEFGAGLEESIRDQLVCGISCEMIRQRLFAEPKLDFSRAYSLAISLESAEKDAAAVVEGQKRANGEATAADCLAIEGTRWRTRNTASGAGEKTVTRYARGTAREDGPRGSHGARGPRHGSGPSRAPSTSSGAQTGRRHQCQACGGAHETSTCRFGHYVCRVCNKTGHLRRVCPNIISNQDYMGLKTTNGSVDSESDHSEENPVAPNIPGLLPGQRVFIVHMPVPGYTPGSIGGYQPVYIVAASPQGNGRFPGNGYQNAVLLDPSGQGILNPYGGYHRGLVQPQVLGPLAYPNRPYDLVYQGQGVANPAGQTIQEEAGRGPINFSQNIGLQGPVNHAAYPGPAAQLAHPGQVNTRAPNGVPAQLKQGSEDTKEAVEAKSTHRAQALTRNKA